MNSDRIPIQTWSYIRIGRPCTTRRFCCKNFKLSNIATRFLEILEVNAEQFLSFGYLTNLVMLSSPLSTDIKRKTYDTMPSLRNPIRAIQSQMFRLRLDSHRRQEYSRQPRRNQWRREREAILFLFHFFPRARQKPLCAS